jgi:transposase, IS30 family
LGSRGDLNSPPKALRRSLTWDQGPEARLKQVGFDADIECSFAPAGALAARNQREHQGPPQAVLPAGTDFSTVTDTNLDAVADELNDRPRKRLAFANPSEQLAKLLLQ